jgi:hypothetical protein
MAIPSNHHGTAAGTLGGTLLSVFASIQSGDITKTIILATVGAVVSFLVSLGLKWIAKKLRTR